MKPTIYCLADPCLFKTAHIGIFNEINGIVDWDMQLVIPLYGSEIIKTIKSMLTNKHITLVAISALLYTGFEKADINRGRLVILYRLLSTYQLWLPM